MIEPGTLLGPYEVSGLLGAGGMGEVYRARDPRIGREVAIKVLHAHVVNDPDRLRRFELEVKSVGALNHPNILAIYDVGTQDGAPYIVSELLEGETLRERLLASGALAKRKAIEFATGVARGLAAAHGKAIVHRDLKPENIFLTKDNRVKILDFGLAKLNRLPGEGNSFISTMTMGTESGLILGTPGYMAPEQVNGVAADHRADIFCFGCVLYEMVSGQRAFRRDTMPETLTAILKEDPPPLEDVALERIVRRCLEKDPDHRFQSAADLAFALENLSGAGTSSVVLPAQRPRFKFAWIGVAAGVLVAAAAAFLLARRFETSEPPVFRQLTFRRGTIYSARFAPDGHSIIYGAYWDGKPPQLYSTRPENPESSALQLPSADILSISASGEMAIARDRSIRVWIMNGTLARVPLEGGAPRDVMDNIQEAAWDLKGTALALVRAGSNGGHRLEYPSGKVLYENAGWISHPRFSPKGDEIAFIDHPYAGDDVGHVAVVDLAGKKRDLTPHYGGGAQGLAWSPQGDEVWYSAASGGTNLELMAVKAAGGKPRVLARVAGRMTLQDVFSDGRVLLTRDTIRSAVMVSTDGNPRERDLAWLDNSTATDLSNDGKTILISEQGVGGGSSYSAYVRKTDGSPAVRIGDGNGLALSPDGKWALTNILSTPPQMIVLPTGAGEPRALPRAKIDQYLYTGGWFADGHRVAFTATEPGHKSRTYVQDVNGGEPRAVTGEGTEMSIAAGSRLISPDQRWIAGVGSDSILRLYPVEGGEPRTIPGMEPTEVSAGWSADGKSLYVYRSGQPTPVKVDMVDVATGKRTLWKEIAPSDPAGTSGILLLVSPDGKSYAYDMWRQLSDLYLVEGIR